MKKRIGHVPAKNVDGEHLEALLRLQRHDCLDTLVQDGIPCVFRGLRVARNLSIDKRKTIRREGQEDTDNRNNRERQQRQTERGRERKQ